jgi:hypothetical protein
MNTASKSDKAIVFPPVSPTHLEAAVRIQLFSHARRTIFVFLKDNASAAIDKALQKRMVLIVSLGEV